MKGSSAKAIYQELVQTLSTGAVAYPAISLHLRAAKCTSESKEALDEAAVTRTDSVDAAILKALTGNSFSSLRTLSRLTYLSR
jgi:hypothetical protein